MKNSLNSLLLIIENPMARKPYQNHIDFLKNTGKLEQAKLFEYLLNEKFKNKHNYDEPSANN